MIKKIFIFATLVICAVLLPAFSSSPQNYANFVLSISPETSSIPFVSGKFILPLTNASAATGIFESLDLGFAGAKNNLQYLLYFHLLSASKLNLFKTYESQNNHGSPLILRESSSTQNSKTGRALWPRLTINLAYGEGSIYRPDSTVDFDSFTIHINSLSFNDDLLSLAATFEARSFDKKYQANFSLSGEIFIHQRKLGRIFVD